METTNLLLNTDADVPMSLPLATGAMQRFPESCQRSSLADQPEMDESVEVDEPEYPRNHTYTDTQREASPSSRFYHAHRSRRISESSTDSGYSSFSHYSQSQSLPSCFNPQPVESSQSSGFYTSRRSRRSTSCTLDSLCEPPALSDCDSMSSASSEGPLSPDGPWYGHGTSVEPPELSERGSPAVEGQSPCERPSSPHHVRSSSSEAVTNELQESMADIDIDKHCTFSKVVVTKFSNPPRYRLKKVKFHQCPICQKSFPRPSGLRTHMNMHTNTKPYTCPYEGCDKSFSVISNAKRHYRTHLVEIPPDQMGLPSEPYTVNFSEPVVVPDSPSHPQLYYAHSPATSTSSLATSLCPSLESSTTSIAQAHSLRYPSRSRSVSLQPSGMPLPAVEEAFGDAASQSQSKRQNLKARTLRWLPMGSDSRTPWKANAVTSRVR